MVSCCLLQGIGPSSQLWGNQISLEFGSKYFSVDNILFFSHHMIIVLGSSRKEPDSGTILKSSQRKHFTSQMTILVLSILCYQV